jgi:hypothetical protein
MTRIGLTAVTAVALIFAGSANAQQPAAPPLIDWEKIQIKTTDLGANTYMLQGQGGNITVAVGTDGIIMVDGQFAPLSDKIKAAIKAIAPLPVKDFHAEVAGRVTRAQASWDVMYDWVARGCGELILGSLDGRLVAGSLFVDGTQTCIYASGVYERSLFDKPLAHYPVWLGIEHAHARGMKTLELGEVPAKGAVSDKEFQIGYFKRGFATDLDDHWVWRWTPGANKLL